MTSPGQWRVRMEYRARNGYGGMNAERALCEVRHTGGGKWRLVSLVNL